MARIGIYLYLIAETIHPGQSRPSRWMSRDNMRKFVVGIIVLLLPLQASAHVVAEITLACQYERKLQIDNDRQESPHSGSFSAIISMQDSTLPSTHGLKIATIKTTLGLCSNYHASYDDIQVVGNCGLEAIRLETQLRISRVTGTFQLSEATDQKVVIYYGHCTSKKTLF